jgi:hypothetical protein
MNPLSLNDLQRALDAGLLKAMRSVIGGMAVAPIIWILMGYFATGSGEPVGPGLDPMLIGAFASAACVAGCLAWWLPERNLAKADFEEYFLNGLKVARGRRLVTDRGQIVATVIRSYFMLRIALVEAIGICGLTLVFLAGPAARAQPLYYLALFPCAIIPFVFLSWMPTEASVTKFFRIKLLRESQDTF